MIESAEAWLTEPTVRLQIVAALMAHARSASERGDMGSFEADTRRVVDLLNFAFPKERLATASGLAVDYLKQRTRVLSALGREEDLFQELQAILEARILGGLGDEPVFHARLTIAATLARSGSREAAMALFEELLQESNGDDQDSVDRRVAALRIMARACRDDGQAEEGLQALAKALRDLEACEGRVPHVWAEVVMERAECLIDLNRTDEAILAYDELVERFSRMNDSGMQAEVGRALIARARAASPSAEWKKKLHILIRRLAHGRDWEGELAFREGGISTTSRDA
jgi:tetratricopeptide (TPR) repeat protein